jgi:hypothetical protein
MCEYSLAQNDSATGLQFNIVQRRLRLLGFKIIGEIPEAFNHRQQFGLTNAYIMYRKL